MATHIRRCISVLQLRLHLRWASAVSIPPQERDEALRVLRRLRAFANRLLVGLDDALYAVTHPPHPQQAILEDANSRTEEDKEWNERVAAAMIQQKSSPVWQELAALASSSSCDEELMIQDDEYCPICTTVFPLSHRSPTQIVCANGHSFPACMFTLGIATSEGAFVPKERENDQGDQVDGNGDVHMNTADELVNRPRHVVVCATCQGRAALSGPSGTALVDEYVLSSRLVCGVCAGRFTSL
jgi:hypothetical protein